MRKSRRRRRMEEQKREFTDEQRKKEWEQKNKEDEQKKKRTGGSNISVVRYPQTVFINFELFSSKDVFSAITFGGMKASSALDRTELWFAYSFECSMRKRSNLCCIM